MNSTNLSGNKRIVPRVTITSPDTLILQIKNQASPLVIDNISLHGIGIRRSSFGTAPGLKQEINGVMIKAAKELAVKIKIVRIGLETVGAIFVEENSELQDFVCDQIQQELIKLNIFKINPALISVVTEYAPWWLKNSDTELLLLLQNGRINRFFLVINNTYLEGKDYGDFRFAAVNDYTHAISELMAPPPTYLMALALNFLNNSQQIPSEIRSMIVQIFNTEDAEITAPGI